MKNCACSSRTRFILTLSFLASTALLSCDDAASSAVQMGSCACPLDQICAQNGLCYDNPACAACQADEVCVGGSCFASDGPCGKCKPNQFCVDQTCSDTPDGGNGGNGGNGENSGNGGNGDDPQNKTCNPVCTPGYTCIDGNCEPDAPVCNGVRCKENQLCDQITGECADTCDGQPACDDECCYEDQVCHPGIGCTYPCDEESEISCPNYDRGYLQCCKQGKTLCQAGTCVLDCGTNVRCGYVCCGDGEICEDNTCKIACDTGIRCGKAEEYCCDTETELCLFQQCHSRGSTCETNNNCSFDEYCDEATMSCVNTDIVPTTCQVIPNFDKFTARPQWHWPDSLPGKKSAFLPDYNQVMMTPVVINMTDDNNDGVIDENDVPDVLFVTFKGNAYTSLGVIRAISGDDGRELAATSVAYYGSDDLGAADIDGDGVPELIASSATEIHALSLVKDETASTGYVWKVKYRIAHGASGAQKLVPSFAHLDKDDDIVDIVTSRGVLNVVDEKFAWKEGCQKALSTNLALADLDGDGIMEIIGNNILDNHCKILLSESHSGYVAVADLMPDSENAEELGELKPEIARAVAAPLEGAFEFYKIYKKDDVWSTKRVWSAPIPINYARATSVGKVNCRDANNKANKYCNSGGGPLVIADFNGDTIPDVGVAARWYYIVYSNDGTATGGKVLWAHSQTQDYSSAATGSSVFDFEGDDKAEVVYADELRLRVYSGLGLDTDADKDGYNDPEILFDIPNSSGTLLEYPVIVDVDNDGSTEIVVASNNYYIKTVTGVRAFEDPGGQWVRTRRIWNQHHYHVTNINEDGSVPRKEEVNWLHPKLNNYRQNVQPGGVYNAPNLVAQNLAEEKLNCTNENKAIRLTATIANEGSLSVKAGLSITFYAQDVNGTGQTVLIAKTTVDKVLHPGSSATATYDWNGKVMIDGSEENVTFPVNVYYVIDEPTKDKLRGEFVECNEEDNTYKATPIDDCHIIY